MQNTAFKKGEVVQLELLLTGNDRNKEDGYLQHKHNAWTGIALDAMDGRNGKIAVSLQFPGYFKTLSILQIYMFYVQQCEVIYKRLKEESLLAFPNIFICPVLAEH
jgi:hypothetical protein